MIRTEATINRPWGIRYALTLHNRTGKRIMGFDNAHRVARLGNKKSIDNTYDHWHRDKDDIGRPYKYENAVKLLEDFWYEVDRIVKETGENHVK